MNSIEHRARILAAEHVSEPFVRRNFTRRLIAHGLRNLRLWELRESRTTERESAVQYDGFYGWIRKGAIAVGVRDHEQLVRYLENKLRRQIAQNEGHARRRCGFIRRLRREIHIRARPLG